MPLEPIDLTYNRARDEFDIEGNFFHQLRVLENAIVYPDRSDGDPGQFGVVNSEGVYEDLSSVALTREAYSSSPAERKLHDNVDFAEGTYLYGGHLRGHFGHFIVEGLSRLWALDVLKVRPKGIVYFPYGGRPSLSWGNIRGRKDQAIHILTELGVKVPIKMINRDTRFERLILPEIGFGHHEKFYGSSFFRRFVCDRLEERAKALPKSEFENVFISRSKLGQRQGTIAGEAAFEEILKDRGYHIFHPQDNSLSDQIAIYANARRILSVEGSALHFAAMVCQTGTKVGMILRRPSSLGVYDSYAKQFKAFKGIDIDVIDALNYIWVGRFAKEPRYDALGVPDYAKIFKMLVQLGYLDDTSTPVSLPAEADFVEEVIERSKRQNIILRRYYLRPPNGVLPG